MKFEDLLDKKNIILLIRECLKCGINVTGYSDILLKNVIDIENIFRVNCDTISFIIISDIHGIKISNGKSWYAVITRNEYKYYYRVIIHQLREQKLKRIFSETEFSKEIFSETEINI